MIARADCERAFRDAVAACDPEVRVRGALRGMRGGYRFGLAIGKAALGMARGAGSIDRGLVVTNADDGRGVPPGWQVMVAAHPIPDARSLEAGDAAIDLIAGARRGERVLALISGGASALCERLAPGVTLDQLDREIGELVARGAAIHEINARRARLSAIKGGKLATMCDASIDTIAISDVFDDDIRVIGSGPTIAPRDGDHYGVIAPMASFAVAMSRHLAGAVYPEGYGSRSPGWFADALVARRGVAVGPVIAWGEPTVRVPPDHGEGGRAQQLALELAARLRGTDRAAFVAGSDGIDGPPPRHRPPPAGAYVDGATWDAIARAGIDPQRALDRRDAGTALAAVGALVVTGPTGINHADVAIVG